MPTQNDGSNNAKPTDSLNANQFDDDGLPGIDENYPPEHSWAVEDPALVNGDSETRDDLRTRMSREQPEQPSPPDATVGALISDQGDPQESPGDDNKDATAATGRRDPDAGISAEEAAMHIVETD